MVDLFPEEQVAVALPSMVCHPSCKSSNVRGRIKGGWLKKEGVEAVLVEEAAVELRNKTGSILPPIAGRNSMAGPPQHRANANTTES